MIVLAPLALAALAVVPLIYLIHLLYGSRRRFRVPAVFLWANLPPAPSAKRRRRWPPPSLLLLLQLAAAALAALALARPAAPADPPRHLALVLDASASMQATDVAPTRFEAARARGLDRLATLRDGEMASIIRSGTAASLLASGTPAQGRQALTAARPSAGAGALRDALALASAQVAATPDLRGEIVVLTDGAWPNMDPLGVLAAPVDLQPVGGASDNQAITALQVRIEPSGREQIAFLELTNYADQPAQVTVRTLGDDAPLDERSVRLPARGQSRLSVPLPADARRITARLLGRDALALDDAAEAATPGAGQHTVLLVSRAPTALRRALEAIPFVRLSVVDATLADRPPAELTVLEGALPALLPNGPLLLVNPPAASTRLAGPGGRQTSSVARPGGPHPLLQGVDLGALRGDSTLPNGAPPWADVVLGTPQGPLVFAGRLDGRPTVVLAFDPEASGLDKSLAFPLLVSNAAAYLLGQSGDQAVRPGDVVTVLAPQSGRAVLTRPDGSRDALQGTGLLRIDATDQAGRYNVLDPATGQSLQAFSVTPIDSLESDIRPRSLSPLPVSAVTAQPLASGAREWWPWVAGAVLALLGLEWLVFARRG